MCNLDSAVEALFAGVDASAPEGDSNFLSDGDEGGGGAGLAM